MLNRTGKRLLTALTSRSGGVPGGSVVIVGLLETMGAVAVTDVLLAAHVE
jgi:hypothetical protein